MSKPNFNQLEEIFNGISVDYFSDRESDRTSIITEVDLHGNLNQSLNKFAEIADDGLKNVTKNSCLNEILKKDGFYLNFNYTHTSEQIYDIKPSHILHIHGEAMCNNLVLGYPYGTFSPDQYYIEEEIKHWTRRVEIDINEFIDNIEDYYIQTAYKELYNKCHIFYKKSKISNLENFINNNNINISRFVVLGHSCKIDYDYFMFLASKYPNVSWTFYYYTKGDLNNIRLLANKCGIKIYKYLPI